MTPYEIGEKARADHENISVMCDRLMPELSLDELSQAVAGWQDKDVQLVGCRP